MTTFSPATSAVPTAAPATIPSGDSPTSLDRTITDAPVNAAVAVPRLANARMDANDFIFDRERTRSIIRRVMRHHAPRVMDTIKKRNQITFSSSFSNFKITFILF